MGAAGDLAAALDRVARRARSPGPSTTKATSLCGGGSRRVPADGLGADEARRLLAGPAQSGLDRPARERQLVAVQRQAGLDPQRVAGAESRRRGAAREQLDPRADPRPAARTSARRRPRRCSRSRTPARARRPGCALAARMRGRQRLVAQPLTIPRAAGPWTASIAKPAASVADLRLVERLRACCWNHCRSRLVVGRVGDGQEALGPEAVGDQVIEHATVLAAQQRVLGPPSRCLLVEADRGDVVGQQPLQQLERLRARWSRSRPCGRRRRPRRTCAPPGARRSRPVYWTGISQPANSTSLPPAARWRSNSGVRCSSGGAVGIRPRLAEGSVSAGRAERRSRRRRSRAWSAGGR